MKIAFYAPIKPPDHPIPSGDRFIATNLMRVLSLAGFEPELISRYIAYSKRHDGDILHQKKQDALVEAERIICEYETLSADERPSLWLTYHPYDKAPDWIGPIVSKAFSIPYVTLEAARTGQGGEEDLWRDWRMQAQNGIKQADMHLVYKPSDWDYLFELLGSDERMRRFPVFVDTDVLDGNGKARLPQHWNKDTPVLVTTGLMRKGKKVQNYLYLADMLQGALDIPWNLVIIGGGPQEDEIRQAFSFIPDERLHWTGLIPHDEVLDWMRASDVFVWPGWKEPIGMVYLEAQMQGLPVLAWESMGVPLVVRNGETGVLTPEGDIEAMQTGMRELLGSPSRRTEMGKAARNMVMEEHSLSKAAARLQEVLGELL